MFDELKAKYDKMTLASIQGEITRNYSTSSHIMRDAILALWYLERTKRFKEDPAYKTSTFEVYAADVYGIQSAQYHMLRKAYINFPDECATYGPGVVAKIIRKAGPVRAKSVLSEIKAEDDKRVSRIKAEKVDEIIHKHVPVITRTHIDWRARYEFEHQLRVNLERENDELKRQVERLKESVRNYMEFFGGIDKTDNPRPTRKAQAGM